MATHYSVIQFVPDPVIDERINIGVVVYDANRCLVKFVEDWNRVEAFGDRDIGFLREFAKDLSAAASGGSKVPLSSESIEQMSHRWINSIQLTGPRGATVGLQELYEDVSARFLRPLKAKRPRARDRRAAIKVARSALEKALKRRRIVEPAKHLQKNLTIEGRVEPHTFEIGIQNGILRGAADGLSFEGSDVDGMRKDLDSIAWSAGDVQALNKKLDLSVVVLTKDRNASIYQRATNIFDRLSVRMVPEDDVTDWAEMVVNTVLSP
jgi:Protein of unknown function (DUF3037)